MGVVAPGERKNIYIYLNCQTPALSQTILFVSSLLQHALFSSRPKYTTYPHKIHRKIFQIFSRLYSAFLYHYIFLLAFLLNWLVLPSCWYCQTQSTPMHSTHTRCPAFQPHITCLPFVSLSNTVFNVRRYNPMPIYSCQPHNLPCLLVPP